jgi:hypothetical protein
MRLLGGLSFIYDSQQESIYENTRVEIKPGYHR